MFDIVSTIMINESQRTPHPESVEGKDYIVNYYTVLGVPQDATEEIIQSTYIEKILQYHPDRLHSAAPELIMQADSKTRLLNRARFVLLRPDARTAYDEQLSTWEGPISKDGTPIVSISMKSILQDDASLNSALERIKQMSGHDEAMFDFIQQQYQSTETPSEILEQAYRAALSKKDLFLGLQEGVYSEKIGVKINDEPPIDYMLDVTSRIDEVRQIREAEIEQEFEMLQSGTIHMLNAGTIEQVMSVLESDPENALAIYKEEASKDFDKSSEIILKIAGEREGIINQRLDLLRIQYIHQQDQLFDRAIIGAIIDGEISWLAYKLDNSSVNPDHAITPEQKESLKNPEKAKEMIENGYNLITFELENGISINDQLSKVITDHFTTYLQATNAEKSDNMPDNLPN